MPTTYAPRVAAYTAGISHRRRRTMPSGAGKTRARWIPAGQVSMYSGPVTSEWRTNGVPCTTSLTLTPRNQGRLLPAVPQAPITRAVAAGSFGRRANTYAAMPALASENSRTLQPASRVAPTAGGAHATVTVRPAPSRASSYGRGCPAPGRATVVASGSPSQSSRCRPSTTPTTSPPRRPGAGSSMGAMRMPDADQPSS